MLAVGYATRLRWFADSSFFAVFLVFFTFGLSMIPIAFVLAILISSSRAAFQAGMLIFVVGIIIQSIVTSPFLLNLIHQPALFEDQPKMVLGLQFYGPYNFAKMMNDVSSRSPQVPSDPDNTGLTWEAVSFFSKKKINIFYQNIFVNILNRLLNQEIYFVDQKEENNWIHAFVTFH